MFLDHFKVVPALGMMHYWEGAHLAPGCWHHMPRSTWYHAVTWVTLWVTPPTPAQLPVWWRASGEMAHMLSTDLKGTKLGHVQFANLASWMKSEETGTCFCEALQGISKACILNEMWLGVTIYFLPFISCNVYAKLYCMQWEDQWKLDDAPHYCNFLCNWWLKCDADNLVESVFRGKPGNHSGMS